MNEIIQPRAEPTPLFWRGDIFHRSQNRSDSGSCLTRQSAPRASSRNNKALTPEVDDHTKSIDTTTSSANKRCEPPIGLLNASELFPAFSKGQVDETTQMLSAFFWA